MANPTKDIATANSPKSKKSTSYTPLGFFYTKIKPLLPEIGSMPDLYKFLTSIKELEYENRGDDSIKLFFFNRSLPRDVIKTIIKNEDEFIEQIRNNLRLTNTATPEFLTFWNDLSKDEITVDKYMGLETYTTLSTYFISSENNDIADLPYFIAAIFFYTCTKCLPQKMQDRNNTTASDEVLQSPRLGITSCDPKTNSEKSNNEFRQLPDFLLSTLHLMAYVTQQQAPSKKGVRFGGEITFSNCSFSRYVFIAACNYFDPSNDIINLLLFEKSIEEWTNEMMKGLFSDHLEVHTDEHNKLGTLNFTFQDITKTLPLLIEEMRYRGMEDSFDFSQKDSILDKKTATQKKVLTVLFDIFMNCGDDFHNMDSILKFELNTTLSNYLHAISFDGFPSSCPENQLLVVNSIQALLYKRNYHQNYFMILVERQLDNNKLILQFDDETSRLELIYQVASAMFEDKSTSYIPGFWKKVLNYIDETPENSSYILKQLIDHNCMDSLVWKTFLSKYPAKNAQNLRYLISTCIEREYKGKLLTTLSFFDKNECYKFIFDDTDIVYTTKFKRYLIYILSNEKEINEKHGKKILDLLQFVETNEKLQKLLLDRKHDKSKNFPSCFSRYLGEEISISISSSGNEDIDHLFSTRALNTKLLLSKVEEDNSLITNTFIRTRLRETFVNYRNGISLDASLRMLFLYFMKSQDNYYDISDLISITFDYSRIQQTDSHFYKVWVDYVKKIKLYSLNSSVVDKLKNNQYRSLIDHLEKIDDAIDYTNYLNDLIEFASTQAVSSNEADQETMFFVTYYIFNKKLTLEAVYKELVENSVQGVKYEKILITLCNHTHAHIDIQIYRKYLERIVSYLLFTERFIHISSALQLQLLHYSKKMPEFMSEYGFLEENLSSPVRWNSLEANSKMAITSRASDDFLASHPCVMEFATTVLDELNSKIPRTSTIKNNYGYQNPKFIYYHLMNIKRQDPLLSARLCCFVLSECLSKIEDLSRRNDLSIKMDFEYSIYFANPCIRQYSFIIAKLSYDIIRGFGQALLQEFYFKYKNFFNCIKAIVEEKIFPDWFEYKYAIEALDYPSLTVLQEVSFSTIDNSLYSELDLNTENKRYMERYESIKSCPKECYSEHPIVTEKLEESYLLIDGAKTYDCWKMIKNDPFTTPPSKVSSYVFCISTTPVIIEKACLPLDADTNSMLKGNNAQYRIKKLYDEFFNKYCSYQSGYEYKASIISTAKKLRKVNAIDKTTYDNILSYSILIDSARYNELPSDKEYFYNNVISFLTELINVNDSNSRTR